MTDYARTKQQIIDFKKMLDGRVTHALEQMNEHGNEKPMDTLHANKISISFMGKECKLFFGSTEYFAIIKALETILEEM